MMTIYDKNPEFNKKSHHCARNEQESRRGRNSRDEWPIYRLPIALQRNPRIGKFAGAL